MSKTLSSLAIFGLLLTGVAVQAEDFRLLMNVTRTGWPAKRHLGVVCDYNWSRDQVERLAAAAGAEVTLTVVDIRRPDQVMLGADLLARLNTDVLVLLPKDRLVRDGSLGGTEAIRRMALRGLPSIGTSRLAIAQGAVFSAGEGTRGEVVVTNQVKGLVGPPKLGPFVARPGAGKASVLVFTAR